MMATRLKEVDAVMIGVGLVGTMLGRELTKAGLKVVGLERGNPQFTVPDFQGPQMHDELRYSVRKAFMQDNTKEAMTFRNNVNQTALPIRRWEGFLPGTGLGGAAVHWNGQTWRFQDSDFQMRTKVIQRYGTSWTRS
jgi:gluconate 2-dehydrogenase alpha chain